MPHQDGPAAESRHDFPRQWLVGHQAAWRVLHADVDFRLRISDPPLAISPPETMRLIVFKFL
jgi:hypothetical protein